MTRRLQRESVTRRLQRESVTVVTRRLRRSSADTTNRRIARPATSRTVAQPAASGSNQTRHALVSTNSGRRRHARLTSAWCVTRRAARSGCRALIHLARQTHLVAQFGFNKATQFDYCFVLFGGNSFFGHDTHRKNRQRNSDVLTFSRGTRVIVRIL